jgi:hypothetical protein
MNMTMTIMAAIPIGIDIVSAVVMPEETTETETMITGEVEVESEIDRTIMKEKVVREAVTITTRIEDMRIIIRVQDMIDRMRAEIFIMKAIIVSEVNEAVPDTTVITIVEAVVAVITKVVIMVETVMAVVVVTVVIVEALIMEVVTKVKICQMNKVIKIA